MKRRLLLGGLIALILIVGGIYVLCIPCQYYEYRALPSVEEVLANPVDRPDPIGTIWLNASINEPRKNEPRLCIEINMVDLMTRDTRKSIYEDFSLQLKPVRERFHQSMKLFIDGYRQVDNLLFAMTHFQETILVDIGSVSIGQHVAFVTFQAPSGQEYSYTWVFEITEDEIIPHLS